MDDIARHEHALTAHALDRLQAIPGLTIYGAGNPVALDNRVGVIAFNLESVPHALVAAILGYEGGIGVRNGCFCAQSYVAHLLGIAARPAGSLAARAPGRATSRPAGHGPAQSRRLQHPRGCRRAGRHAGAHRPARLSWGYCRALDSSDYSPAGYHETILDYFPLLSGEPVRRTH